MRLIFFTLFLSLCLASISCDISSAAGAREVEIKAAYMFNFTRFVDWSDFLSAAGQPIAICIYGNDPIEDLLQDVDNREVQGHPLKVERIAGTQQSLAHCQILFVSRSEESHLDSILQQAHRKGTLTVSDIPHFSRRGGMVGFVTENARVKIEINLTKARDAGLKVSAKLLEVARIVP